MMLSLHGVIRGNTVLLENDSLERFDGREVTLVIEGRPKIDFSKYRIGESIFPDAQEYVAELRNNDRV